MIACIVIGVIILFLVVLLLLPIGIAVEYAKSGLQLAALVGPLHIKLYPKKNVQKKTGRSKRRRPAKKKEKPSSGMVNRSRGGSLSLFEDFLGLAVKVQSALRNHLRIQQLSLSLTIGGMGDDPAKAGVNYGRAWGAIGMLWPWIQQTFRVKNPCIQAYTDFTSDQTTIYVEAVVVIAVGSLLWLVIHYGLCGFNLYRKHLKKGGSKYGSSNQ